MHIPRCFRSLIMPGRKASQQLSLCLSYTRRGWGLGPQRKEGYCHLPYGKGQEKINRRIECRAIRATTGTSGVQGETSRASVLASEASVKHACSSLMHRCELDCPGRKEGVTQEAGGPREDDRLRAGQVLPDGLARSVQGG